MAERPGDLKLGMFLPVGGKGMMGGADPRWSDLVAMARRAEEIGLDFVGVLDHLLFHHWECWTVLSALAASTSRLELLSYVSCTGYRNPALLAKMADTLDEISGGRLVLGLGAGDSTSEHVAFGYPTERPVSRFAEAVEIITTLLREGRIDEYDGEFYKMSDITLEPRGPRPQGPPILIGGLGGDRMLRLGARHADITVASMLATQNTPEGLAREIERVDAACQRIGRDPATLERLTEVVVQFPDGPDAEWWDGRVVTGAPNEIADGLREMADQGAQRLMLWIEPNSVEGLERFAPVVGALRRR